MKTSATRIIRRRKRTSADGAFFRKESQESGFFADTAHEAFFQPADNSVQRKCAGCEDEEKVQRTTDKKEEENKLKRSPEKKEEEKKLQQSKKKKDEKKEIQVKSGKTKDEDEQVRRITDKKEDEKLQKKDEDIKDKEEKKVQRKENGGNLAAPATTVSYVSTLDSKGTSLPPESRNFFETRMGYDFSHVKIHTGSDAEHSAKEVNAKAYTVQNHIVFNEGQFDPGSNPGKRLLAHELTHVVQKDEKKISQGVINEHPGNIGHQESME